MDKCINLGEFLGNLFDDESGFEIILAMFVAERSGIFNRRHTEMMEKRLDTGCWSVYPLLRPSTTVFLHYLFFPHDWGVADLSQPGDTTVLVKRTNSCWESGY
jgi:hypothetical protein